MPTKRNKLKGLTGSTIVAVDLRHWSHSVSTFDNGLYGYNLLKAIPQLSPGHGIRLRVTVEVLDPGVTCLVRNAHDGKKCSQREESK